MEEEDDWCGSFLQIDRVESVFCAGEEIDIEMEDPRCFELSDLEDEDNDNLWISLDKEKPLKGSRGRSKKGQREVLKCENCQFETRKQASMVQHSLSAHTGLLKYSCKSCSALFSTSQHLAAHCSRYHKIAGGGSGSRLKEKEAWSSSPWPPTKTPQKELVQVGSTITPPEPEQRIEKSVPSSSQSPVESAVEVAAAAETQFPEVSTPSPTPPPQRQRIEEPEIPEITPLEPHALSSSPKPAKSQSPVSPTLSRVHRRLERTAGLRFLSKPKPPQASKLTSPFKDLHFRIPNHPEPVPVLPELLRCKNCQFVARKESVMVRHCQTAHTSWGEFGCRRCNSRFSSSQHLASHCRAQHPKRPRLVSPSKLSPSASTKTTTTTPSKLSASTKTTTTKTPLRNRLNQPTDSVSVPVSKRKDQDADVELMYKIVMMRSSGVHYLCKQCGTTRLSMTEMEAHCQTHIGAGVRVGAKTKETEPETEKLFVQVEVHRSASKSKKEKVKAKAQVQPPTLSPKAPKLVREVEVANGRDREAEVEMPMPVLTPEVEKRPERFCRISASYLQTRRRSQASISRRLSLTHPQSQADANTNAEKTDTDTPSPSQKVKVKQTRVEKIPSIRITRIEDKQQGPPAEMAPPAVKKTPTISRNSGENKKNAAVSEKFECRFCGVEISQKSNFSLHLISAHGKWNPFPCELCENFRFKTLGALKSHEYKVHGRRISGSGSGSRSVRNSNSNSTSPEEEEESEEESQLPSPAPANAERNCNMDVDFDFSDSESVESLDSDSARTAQDPEEEVRKGRAEEQEDEDPVVLELAEVRNPAEKGGKRRRMGAGLREFMKFSCLRCGGSFDTCMELSMHYKICAGTENSFRCSACGPEEDCFDSLWRLKAHVWKKHVDKVDKEKILQEKNQNISILSPDALPYKCLLCKHYSPDKRSFILHLSSPHVFSCKKCKFRALTQTALKDHRKTHQNEVDNDIEIVFERRAESLSPTPNENTDPNEKEEEEEDEGYGSLICELCGTASATVEEAKDHSQMIDEIQSVMCDQCGLLATSPCELILHLKAHDGGGGQDAETELGEKEKAETESTLKKGMDVPCDVGVVIEGGDELEIGATLELELNWTTAATAIPPEAEAVAQTVLV